MMTRNRLLIIIGVLGIILVGLVVYTFAILLPNNNAPSVASITPTPVTTPTTTKTAKTRKVVGTIQSLSAQTLLVAPTHGKKTFTVNVDESTKYTTPAGPGSFSDLKVGQSVEVKGQVDAQDATVILAKSITVTPPTGKVSAIDGQTLTLTTSDAKTVTLHTTSATTVNASSIPVTFSLITIGQTLSYVGTSASDGSVNATTLYLILSHARGTVTAINGQTLSIQLADGTSQAFNLNTHTTYVKKGASTTTGTPSTTTAQAIKIGSQVDVFYNGSATGGNAMAVLVKVR